MWTDKTGKFSAAKFWTMIAYGIGTYIVVRVTEQDKMTADMLLVYLATIGSSEIAKKYLTMKHESKTE